MSKWKSILESLRPAQWVKNLLLFAPLVFGHLANQSSEWIQAAVAFLAFCAASSGIYLINDIRDREADRRHPLKWDRPIAKGVVGLKLGTSMSICLLAGALLTGWWVGIAFLATLAAYIVLQLAYSFYFKRIILLDVFSVAVGFVLRPVAGACAIQVFISPWLLVCSLTLALFLALAKRRHEIILLEVSAREHRAALTHYSPYFLDQLIGVTTATTVVGYAMYTLAPETVEKFGTHNLVLTLPFVIYGVFRYLYLIHQRKEGGNPTRMFLTDHGILLNTALWLVVSAYIVYS